MKKKKNKKKKKTAFLGYFKKIWKLIWKVTHPVALYRKKPFGNFTLVVIQSSSLLKTLSLLYFS